MRRLTAVFGLFSAFLLVVMFVCIVLQIWTTGNGSRWGDTAVLTGLVGLIGVVVAAAVWDERRYGQSGKR